MPDPFFIIETSKVPASRAVFTDWFEFERHPQFWTARNRVRVMLEKQPKLSGHVRIVRTVPLDGLALAP